MLLAVKEHFKSRSFLQEWLCSYFELTQLIMLYFLLRSCCLRCFGYVVSLLLPMFAGSLERLFGIIPKKKKNQSQEV